MLLASDTSDDTCTWELISRFSCFPSLEFICKNTRVRCSEFPFLGADFSSIRTRCGSSKSSRLHSPSSRLKVSSAKSLRHFCESRGPPSVHREHDVLSRIVSAASLAFFSTWNAKRMQRPLSEAIMHASVLEVTLSTSSRFEGADGALGNRKRKIDGCSEKSSLRAGDISRNIFPRSLVSGRGLRVASAMLADESIGLLSRARNSSRKSDNRRGTSARVGCVRKRTRKPDPRLILVPRRCWFRVNHAPFHVTRCGR